MDWSRKLNKGTFQPALRRYQRYLENLGFRESTIESYVFRAGKYLEFAKTDFPTEGDHSRFREYIQDKRLARNTLNNYGFAVRKYHEMIGKPTKFNYVKPNDTIPYYFSEDDVARIFSVCQNLKHYAMLMTMFYEALRVSELCGLNDDDLDFETLNIRVRGKWGREDLVPINADVANVLRNYLAIRPSITIDSRKPLFITDYLKRWNRMDVYRMFREYKKKAEVNKHGGLHVFGRHTPASIMIKNGCDISTVQEIMRHKDITTTARYLHVSDEVKRSKYVKSLKL